MGLLKLLKLILKGGIKDLFPLGFDASILLLKKSREAGMTPQLFIESAVIQTAEKPEIKPNKPVTKNECPYLVDAFPAFFSGTPGLQGGCSVQGNRPCFFQAQRIYQCEVFVRLNATRGSK